MKKICIGICTLLLCITSCVTKKKYLEAENGRLEAIEWGELLDGQLNDCLDEKLKQSNRLHTLLPDTSEMGKSLRQYDAFLNSTLTEPAKFNAPLEEKTAELSNCQTMID